MDAVITGVVARHTILRERPTFVDDGHGNTEPDFTDVQPVSLPGWAVDAGSTAEDEQNREGALIQYTIRGPLNADVETRDRVILMGDRYAIDGAVVRVPGPSAVTSHTIVQLKRWEG